MSSVPSDLLLDVVCLMNELTYLLTTGGVVQMDTDRLFHII